MPQLVFELPDKLFAYARIEADQPVTDEEFWELCAANPDLHLEREPNGEVVMVPFPGFETGYRNNELSSQLMAWAKRDGRGVAVDSSTDYYLSNGAARKPDASWVLKSHLTRFSKEEKRKFLQELNDAASIAGEGPVAGFVLDLGPIWRGL
jgi:Uma2 family endonuclease